MCRREGAPGVDGGHADRRDALVAATGGDEADHTRLERELEPATGATQRRKPEHLRPPARESLGQGRPVPLAGG